MSIRAVTSATPLMLVEECKRIGISQPELLRGTDLSPASLQFGSGRVPVEQVYALWDNIIRLTHDEMFGLHAAENVPFGVYRVQDYMFAVSASPREALERSSRSFALINDAFRHSVCQHRDLAYLELLNAEEGQDIPRPYIEYILVNYLVRLRMVTRTRFMPIEVHLTYRKPHSIHEYENIFSAPVRFQQAANRLIFPQHLMEVRQPLADPELCELLESYARQQLREQSPRKSPMADVREALMVNLVARKLTLPTLARELAKSTRSLQREFHANGTPRCAEAFTRASVRVALHKKREA
jgi:hypothetical protein